jgi:hypothetical protein
LQASQVEGQQIPAEFTYSVTWRETTVPFEKRMDKYRRYQFLPQHLEARTQPCCYTLALPSLNVPFVL